MSTTETEQFWETFYADGKARWSGKVNAALAAEADGLTPGRALDLGCGQGGDAIWLARAGWDATGVDVSSVALARAEEAAREAGVTVEWLQADLAAELPAGPFDLVTSAFLHSPVELPRADILRAGAARVAPGGTFLVIGHAPSEEHPHAELQTARETLAELALPDEEWAVETCEERELTHTFHGDEHAHARVDAVLRLRRRSV